MWCKSLLVVACMLAAPQAAFSKGLFLRLPADGTWAKYRMTYKLFGPSARDSSRVGELKISCVGTVIEDGERCRWVEIRDENRHRNGKVAYVHITKFLIATGKNEREGKPERSNILRLWKKQNGKKPQLISGPLKDGISHLVYFPGGTTDPDQPRKPKLRTFVVDGTKIQSTDTDHYQSVFHGEPHHVTDFRTWAHAKSPYGVAGAEITVRHYRSRELLSTFRRTCELMETGTGAVSVMPNHE